MIWGHRINLKKYGKQLNRLNRIASTAATAIEKTTPQASLEMLTNILPLDLHIKEVGMNSYTRLKSQLDKPSSKVKTFHITHLQYLVRVAPDCNRSYCEDSFSGYSGSV